MAEATPMNVDNGSARDRPPFSDGPLMVVLVMLGATLVLAGLVVGGLQLSPACREWRAWKASKQGPGFHTMELMLPPFYCIGSRDPTP